MRTCLSLILGLVLASLQPAWGRPVPDNTLGDESSRVTGRNGNFEIDRGARRGRNLFHSFQDFDVDAGGSVYFLDPGVSNIFSRVTGSNPSNILGTLGVRGSANLFLLNPNGILFGPNARLDVSGSFVGTTANAIQFGERGFFSATNPEPVQLLDINPSAFFFNQVNPAPIISQSAVTSLNDPSEVEGLQVRNGHLLLLGGEIQLQQAQLSATDGRVELGAVRSGSVGLSNNEFDLIFPANSILGNITFADSTIRGITLRGLLQPSLNQIELTGNQVQINNSDINSVNVSSQPGGFIGLQANQLGLDSATIGTVTIAPGNSGNITVNANTIDMQNSDGIVTFSFGPGNAGDINIRANQRLSLRNQANISSLVSPPLIPSISGTGSPGSVAITAGSLDMQNARIVVSSFLGRGQSRNVTLLADQINLNNAAIATSSLGANNSGDIIIDTRELNLANESGLLTSAGDPLSLNLLDSVSDETTVALIRQFLENVSPGEFGQGDSGNITINARGAVRASGGSTIATATVGRGQGGNLNILADSITLSGLASSNGIPTSLISSTQGAGNAGNISLRTERLRVSNGAQVATSALAGSSGRGGDMRVVATDSIDLTGNPTIRGGLGSETAGTGRAGNVSIDTRRLRVRSGAAISTSSFGPGRGGNLTVNARDSIDLASTTADRRSGLGSEIRGSGDAGNVRILTRQLRARGGAGISASTLPGSTGRGGDLTVIASDSMDLAGTTPEEEFVTGVGSESQGLGQAGNVSISTRQLRVSNGAAISTRSFNRAGSRSGNLTVQATDAITLAGASDDRQFSSGLFSGTASAGRAGNLLVETSDLRLQDGGEIIASTFGRGDGGNVSVLADRIDLNGVATQELPSGIASESRSRAENAGDAGNVEITANQMNIRDQAGVSTRTFGGGNGGALNLNIDDLTLTDRAIITAQSRGNNPAGNITLNVENLNATDSEITTSAQAASGGAIKLNGGNIRLQGDSDVRTQVARGDGGGGNITVDADSLVALADSDLIAAAEDGQGGNINLGETVAFFNSASPGAATANPDTLEDNNSADLNATGAIPGIITLPDTSFIQNSLTDLPSDAIDIDNILANSCIVRSRTGSPGSFVITGSDGLPERPGNAVAPAYPTGTVRPIPEAAPAPDANRRWQIGDPIVEPQGVYRLPDGRLIMSRDCQPDL